MDVIKPLTFALILMLSLCIRITAQNAHLDVGLRLQKTVGLYLENGVTVQYSSPQLMTDRLCIGMNYISSRLGTAWGSHAIRQDNWVLFGAFIFRPERVIRPSVRLNTGWFHADYEEKVFDVLPNNSLLLSLEPGVVWAGAWALKLHLSFGYNLITGDGMEGPGTLYPLYWQTSVTWNILRGE